MFVPFSIAPTRAITPHLPRTLRLAFRFMPCILVSGMMCQYDVESMVKNGFKAKLKDAGDNASATATDGTEVCMYMAVV